MEQRIAVGLLGLGTIGTSHARALHELRERAALVAYSGGDHRRVAEAGWPDATAREVEDLVADDEVDVVAVCSPSGAHAAHARAALEAGKHVVVEKPLALSVADAEAIIADADRRSLTVSVISQRRLEPEVRAVKEALDAGRLGRIHLATTQVHWWRDESYYTAAAWRGDPARGGGSLLNQGVHNVDLLHWLAGPAAAVTAQSATLAHDTDAEDTTVATIRFASGALGLVSTSTATPPGDPATLTLHCGRGVVEIGQGEIRRWDVDGVPAPSVGAEGEGIGVGASDPTAIGIAGHVQQWADVLTAISDREPATITGRDGAGTVRLLEAITTAARTGRLVIPEELR